MSFTSPLDSIQSHPATVLKFGGAALVDGPGIQRAGRILAERGGGRSVVVVSALAGVTEALDTLGRDAAEGREPDLAGIRIRHRTVVAQLGLEPELCDRHLAELTTVLRAVAHRRRLRAEDRDCLLSYGERMSARLMAAHLRERGTLATPVDAFDLGLASDSNHGSARPLPGYEVELREALDQVPGIPVVTGFLAADSMGNLTTLGPNGSDYSAALLAAAIEAREVQFWKLVPGVMTADPTLVPTARVHPRLSYTDAAAYARAGAGVLHPETIGPLADSATPARVLDLEHPDAPGTIIAPGPPLDEPVGVVVAGDGRGPAGRTGSTESSGSTGPIGVTVCGAASPVRAREMLQAAGIEILMELPRIPGPCPRFAVAEASVAAAARALHHGFFERIGDEELLGEHVLSSRRERDR